MSYFIQIGAGAGDRDERLDFKDGFTKFVKEKINNQNNILVVEANPHNIRKLKDCWREYSNVKIFNIAIVDSHYNKDDIKLYYTESDAPCYQITSINKEHVTKHYPNDKIIEINVQSQKINDFLIEKTKSEIIEYLSIDVEGIDYDLLMDIDFDKLKIKNISFEFIHLNEVQIKNVFNRLIKNGFTYSGKGFDINGFDLMFKKKINFFLELKTKYRLYRVLKKMNKPYKVT